MSDHHDAASAICAGGKESTIMEGLRDRMKSLDVEEARLTLHLERIRMERGVVSDEENAEVAGRIAEIREERSTRRGELYELAHASRTDTYDPVDIYADALLQNETIGETVQHVIASGAMKVAALENALRTKMRELGRTEDVMAAETNKIMRALDDLRRREAEVERAEQLVDVKKARVEGMATAVQTAESRVRAAVAEQERRASEITGIDEACQADLIGTRSQLDASKAQGETCRSNLKSTSDRLSVTEKKSSECGQSLKATSEQLSNVEREAESCQVDLSNTEERLQTSTTQRESCRNELKSTAESLESYTKESHACASELRSATERLDATTDEARSCNTTLTTTEKKLKAFTNEAVTCRDELATTKDELDVSSKQRLSCRSELTSTNERLNATTEDALSCQDDLRSTAEQLSLSTQDAQSCRSDLKSTAEKLEVSASEADACLDELRSAENQLLVSTAQCESFQRDVEIIAGRLNVTANHAQTCRVDLKSVEEKLASSASDIQTCRSELKSTANARDLSVQSEQTCKDDLNTTIAKLIVSSENTRSCRDDLKIAEDNLGISADERDRAVADRDRVIAEVTAAKDELKRVAEELNAAKDERSLALQHLETSEANRDEAIAKLDIVERERNEALGRLASTEKMRLEIETLERQLSENLQEFGNFKDAMAVESDRVLKAIDDVRRREAEVERAMQLLDIERERVESLRNELKDGEQLVRETEEKSCDDTEDLEICRRDLSVASERGEKFDAVVADLSTAIEENSRISEMLEEAREAQDDVTRRLARAEQERDEAQDLLLVAQQDRDRSVAAVQTTEKERDETIAKLIALEAEKRRLLDQINDGDNEACVARLNECTSALTATRDDLADTTLRLDTARAERRAETHDGQDTEEVSSFSQLDPRYKSAIALLVIVTALLAYYAAVKGYSTSTERAEAAFADDHDNKKLASKLKAASARRKKDVRRIEELEKIVKSAKTTERELTDKLQAAREKKNEAASDLKEERKKSKSLTTRIEELEAKATVPQHGVDKMKRSIEDTSRDLASSRKEIATLTSQVANLKDRVQRERSKAKAIVEKEKENLEDLRKQLEEAHLAKSTSMSELHETRGHVEDLTAQLRDAEQSDESQTLRKKLASAKQSNEVLTSKVDELTRQVEQERSRMKEMIEREKERIESVRDELRGVHEKHLSSASEELNRAAMRRVDSIIKTLEPLEADMARYRAERTKLLNDAQMSREEVSRLTSDIRALRSELASMSRRAKADEEAKRVLAEDLNEVSEECDALRSSLADAHKQKEDHAGRAVDAESKLQSESAKRERLHLSVQKLKKSHSQQHMDYEKRLEDLRIESQSSIQDRQEQIEFLKSKIEELEDRAERARLASERDQTAVRREYDVKVSTLEKKLSSYESKRIARKQERIDLETLLAETKERLDQSERDATSAQEALRKVKESNAENLREVMSQNESEIRRMRDELDRVSNNDEDYIMLRDARFEEQRKRVALQEELDVLHEKWSKSESDMRELRLDYERLEREREETSSKVQLYKKELDKHSEQVESTSEQLAESRKRNEALRSALDKTTELEAQHASELLRQKRHIAELETTLLSLNDESAKRGDVESKLNRESQRVQSLKLALSQIRNELSASKTESERLRTELVRAVSSARTSVRSSEKKRSTSSSFSSGQTLLDGSPVKTLAPSPIAESMSTTAASRVIQQAALDRTVPVESPVVHSTLGDDLMSPTELSTAEDFGMIADQTRGQRVAGDVRVSGAFVDDEATMDEDGVKVDDELTGGDVAMAFKKWSSLEENERARSIQHRRMTSLRDTIHRRVSVTTLENGERNGIPDLVAHHGGVSGSTPHITARKMSRDEEVLLWAIFHEYSVRGAGESTRAMHMSMQQFQNFCKEAFRGPTPKGYRPPLRAQIDLIFIRCCGKYDALRQSRASRKLTRSGNRKRRLEFEEFFETLLELIPETRIGRQIDSPRKFVKSTLRDGRIAMIARHPEPTLVEMLEFILHVIVPLASKISRRKLARRRREAADSGRRSVRRDSTLDFGIKESELTSKTVSTFVSKEVDPVLRTVFGAYERGRGGWDFGTVQEFANDFGLTRGDHSICSLRDLANLFHRVNLRSSAQDEVADYLNYDEFLAFFSHLGLKYGTQSLTPEERIVQFLRWLAKHARKEKVSGLESGTRSVLSRQRRRRLRMSAQKKRIMRGLN